jgi:hypothetical protein
MALWMVMRCRTDYASVPQDHADLREVCQQMALFWRLVEQSLAPRLHAPTHPRLDSLLKKLEINTISTKEAMEVYQLIKDRSQELIVEGDPRPDLEFPRMMTLWALEVRLGLVGQVLGVVVREKAHPR